MRCDEVQGLVVEEAALAAEAVRTHLAQCAACQDFQRAHAAALRLAGATPRAARRLPLERIRRRAGLVAAAGLALAGAGGWWALVRTPAGPVPLGEALVARTEPARLEGQLQPEIGAVSSLDALAALTREVHRDARRNPAVQDAAYRPFGALPAWVALRTTPPLRTLGGAVSPLVYSLEE